MNKKKFFYNKNKNTKPKEEIKNVENKNLNIQKESNNQAEVNKEFRKNDGEQGKKKFFDKKKHNKPHHNQNNKIAKKHDSENIALSNEQKQEQRPERVFEHKGEHKPVVKQEHKPEIKQEQKPVQQKDQKQQKPKHEGNKLSFIKAKEHKHGNKPNIKNKESNQQVIPDLKFFADFVKRQIPKHIYENKNFLQIEPLALLEYEHELKLKDIAFKEFLKKNNINARIDKITPSVKARNYRTTTKRKIHTDKNKFFLVFSEEKVINYNNLVSISLLEPTEHKEIYLYIAEKINSPAYTLIGKGLNYVIIRGTYTDFTIIFNVHQMNADIVRKVKLLGEDIKKVQPKVKSVFMYLDPTKSDYYLESSRPDVAVSFKNIFGPDKILVNFNGNKYSFLPTSFSQVNESIVPTMLEKVKNLLQPKKEQVLIDLYSGYGLFSQYLADFYADVYGMEADTNAVKSAKENVEFANKKNARFVAARVTNANIDKYIPRSFRYDEIFILDPPKIGTEDRVVQAVASRNPEKVLHVFCGVDNIPDELVKWASVGYQPSVIMPVDMFPGSANLEVFVLLNRK